MSKVIIHLAPNATHTACGISLDGVIAFSRSLKLATCLRCKRSRIFQRLRDASTAKRYRHPNAEQLKLFSSDKSDKSNSSDN